MISYWSRFEPGVDIAQFLRKLGVMVAERAKLILNVAETSALQVFIRIWARQDHGVVRGCLAGRDPCLKVCRSSCS